MLRTPPPPVFILLFETGSFFVAYCVLELAAVRYLSLPSARVTGVSHHAWQAVRMVMLMLGETKGFLALTLSYS